MGWISYPEKPLGAPVLEAWRGIGTWIEETFLNYQGPVLGPYKYVNHIYGKDELGGTSVLYLSSIPFEELGFPTLDSEPFTELSEAVATYGTPGVAFSVAGLLGGLYYWFSKHEKNAESEATASPGQEV